ncbi:MAG: O-antigen ligase family protein [Ignavibacteriaceae bacterium]|nr:O-antigen ligase family protein [Ignavibacteriaceae bacterium]MCU0406729.1 O-antigen ligase family protein [Ignavibacteriaceae bacterium]
MAKKNTNIGLSILFGITFLAPVTYSLLAYEMDVIQRMFFFSISLLLFLTFIFRFKIDKSIHLNKLLLILLIIFPFTLLTAFVNDSANLLLLKLSDIIIPLSILIQSSLLYVILGEDKFFKVISYSTVIISTLFSIIGVLEVFEIVILPLPTVMPPGSVLGHRGFAAEYLLPAIPFFLIAKNYLEKEKKHLLLIAAIVNISFLLFTRSRAGIIILIAATVLYIVFIFVKKEKGERFALLKAVMLVLVASFLISLIPIKVGERPDLKSTAASFFDEDFKSNILRLNFWDASLQMIKEEPLTGKGLYKWSGFYPQYSGDYFNDKNLFLVHNIHAHNDLLEILAESGIAASLIFILIYLTILFNLFSKSRRNEKYFPLLMTFLITFAFSFVSFPNHKFASYFYAAVAGGTALISSKEKSSKPFKTNLNHFKWVLLALIILGGSLSYIKVKSELSYGQAIYLKERRQYPLMLQKLEEISEIFYPLDASKQPVDYYRGIANSYLGRHSEALNNNLSAQELTPFNPIVMRNVAASYQAMGNLQNAIEQYEKVRKYFPNYINAQINLLDLYSETGKTENAEVLFNELIKKSPDNPRLLEFKSKLQIE